MKKEAEVTGNVSPCYINPFNYLIPPTERTTQKHKADCLYSVKTGYSTLCAENEIEESWSRKQIWKKNLFPKVICFTWTALYETCLTQYNLNRRKMHLVNRCYMCKQCIATNSRLLLDCSVATDIWNILFSFWAQLGYA